MVEGLKFGRGLSDVTLSCDGGYKAHLHKLILASASLYFYQVLLSISSSFNEQLTIFVPTDLN